MREECIIAIVMCGISLIGSLLTKNDRKKSVLFLLLAALGGSLAAGMGVRFREIVEGPFGFLDSVLCIVCGTLFVWMLQVCGFFDRLLDRVLCIRFRALRAIAVLFLIALPAMLSGFVTLSLLTTGKTVAKRMKARGLDDRTVGTDIAAGAFLGMILPPNCLPAIIAANGAGSVLPTPYVGFFLPLLVLGLPAFLLYALTHQKSLVFEKCSGVKLPTAETVIFGLVSLAVLVDGLLASFVYIGGLTLIFTLGTAALLFTKSAPKSIVRLADTFADALMAAAVPAAFTFALGSFIEVSSMSGVRGWYSLIILPYKVPMVMLVMLAIMLVLGLFFSVPLPAFLATYAVFPIGWLANTVTVTGVAAGLCLAYFLAVKGGLAEHTKTELELKEFGWKDLLKAFALPAVLVLALGLVMIFFGDSLKFLVL